MGEPPGDPDEIQEIGSRLLDREDEEPPYPLEARAPPDGWTYEGITSFTKGSSTPLEITGVHAIQKRPVAAGGTFLHRRLTLREEQRVGPAEGGSPDHRELESDKMFSSVGIVTNHRDGPLTDTAGVVMAQIGFGVDDPLWYWTSIEHEATVDEEDQ